MKERIAQHYARHVQDIRQAVLDIHTRPELSEEEWQACRIQTQLLKKWEFDVEAPYKELQTAFNAVSGRGRPHVCFMSEYDALPDIGHGCGHNLIAGVALGAGVVLKSLMAEENLPGRVTVMGTPAEEKRGCKIDLIRAGALADVDIVLMAHPSDHPTSQSVRDAGILQLIVRFQGKAAHAAEAPEKGLNALDAVRLAFSGVDAWRQQLPEACRIHGVIRNGGVAPNIIPDAAEADFYLRSPDLDFLRRMQHRFENIVQGAALMTDTGFQIELVPNAFKPGKPNPELNRAFMVLAREYGMNPQWRGPSRASSDFGDVTHEVPAMHAFFNITDKDDTVVIHSREFAQRAASDFALAQMGRTAVILSEIGYRYMTEEDFRERVNRTSVTGGSEEKG